MASTYSDLKIELIGSGEQAGTWGATTNTNLGTAIQEAITGSADVAFSSSDVTLTLTDTNASQEARNLRLNLTGTSGGARNLILGSGCQIEKLYLINNGLADTVTVKNTTGTGTTVAAGKSKLVYNDGTNVVDAVTSLAGNVDLTTDVTGTLPVANGGTGITSFGAGVATWLGTPSSANLAAAVTGETGSGALVFGTSPTITSATLVTPDLGVPTSGNLDNCINLPISTGVSGLGSNVATFLGTPSSANLASALTDETGSGLVMFNANPLVTTARETVTVTASAASSTVQFDAITQSVLYYTSNASGNWTVNVRGNSGTSLDSIMSTGQSMTLVFLVTQGSTAYYQSALTIDGSSVTPKWQGGAAPTAGNASGVDAYVITIVKTGSATFTVFESQTPFA
jgi:hypothetical protein